MKSNKLNILGGLLLVSVSLLGLIGYILYQRQNLLVQSKILAKNQSPSLTKPKVLGAIGLAQNNTLNQAEKLAQSPQPKIGEPTTTTLNDQIQTPKLAVNQTQGLEVDTQKKALKSDPVIQNKNNPSSNSTPNIVQNLIQKPNTTSSNPKKQTNYKILTPKDFHDILLNHNFENTNLGNELLSATGLQAADDRINQIAQGRGFQRWPEAIETELLAVKPGIKLQPKAKQAYLEMIAAAKVDQVIIEINSGYRSQSDQNRIFKPRYQALEFAELGGNYTPEDLAKGEGDELLSRIMKVTAPPGYSRHHTGYTVDLVDLSPDNTSLSFKNSKADQWLSRDNFANARRFGFIPSYPEGLDGVGPQPEAWEYVWVGESAR